MTLLRFALLALLAPLAFGAACGGDDGGGVPSGPCDEVLKTGIVAQQTGVSADSFDCDVIAASTKYNEPDPMLFKAVMYGESRFDYKSIGCTNFPCGMPAGWSADESGCLGLMQIVPACGGTPGNIGLRSDGHPNMTIDMSSPDFATSIFKPSINIEVGISGLAGNRDEVKMLYPGCTEDQYTLMALSNYASHGSAKGCTTVNTSYLDYMLPAYFQYATAAGYPAHDYNY
ncbi:MAG TPA: transglycosylase SLT domain-containing protein [Kofleriaceae bacterium]|nr:transglycosylase SLT domain-containing protein [Kofleriaceae bacterium]